MKEILIMKYRIRFITPHRSQSIYKLFIYILLYDILTTTESSQTTQQNKPFFAFRWTMGIEQHLRLSFARDSNWRKHIKGQSGIDSVVNFWQRQTLQQKDLLAVAAIHFTWQWVGLLVHKKIPYSPNAHCIHYQTALSFISTSPSSSIIHSFIHHVFVCICCRYCEPWLGSRRVRYFGRSLVWSTSRSFFFSSTRNASNVYRSSFS